MPTQKTFDFSDPLQPTLFDEWVTTPHGREIARRFIALAVGLHTRRKHLGPNAIVERIRWNMTLRSPHSAEEDGFRVNDKYTSGLARFAVDRRPDLHGFFRLRTQKNSQYMPRTVLTQPKGRIER